MEPLLSICIATYKRADFIGPTLESIVGQLSPAVEVVVVDGASPDHTEEVVQGFCVRSPYVRYVRLEKKGGVDQDYDRSVTEFARGRYCWLFTDDDLLVPGAVEAVATKLREGYDLVVVNAEVRDLELKGVVEEKRLRFVEDRAYEPGEMDQLFTECGFFMTFIGCVVIRRALWLERARHRFFGSEFIHEGVIFQTRLPGRAVAIAKPCILIRWGNAQWMKRGFEIWFEKWPRLVWSLDGISDGAKRFVVQDKPWASAKELAKARALGMYSHRNFWEFVAKRPLATWKRVLAWLISICPPALLKAALLMWFKYKGRDEGQLAWFRKEGRSVVRALGKVSTNSVLAL